MNFLLANLIKITNSLLLLLVPTPIPSTNIMESVQADVEACLVHLDPTLSAEELDIFRARCRKALDELDSGHDDDRPNIQVKLELYRIWKQMFRGLVQHSHPEVGVALRTLQTAHDKLFDLGATVSIEKTHCSHLRSRFAQLSTMKVNPPSPWFFLPPARIDTSRPTAL
jgi:hypothetical protein